jgi:hypothetical protein
MGLNLKEATKEGRVALVTKQLKHGGYVEMRKMSLFHLLPFQSTSKKAKMKM